MTAPNKFSHVVYATHRYDEMLEFYLTLFDAKIQQKNDTLCFATYDDEHHRFAFVNLGPSPEHEPERAAPKGMQPGVTHLSYCWEGLPGLLETYKRARDEFAVEPVQCLRHGPTLSIYVPDPDGNILEWQIDLLDPDEANAFMVSDEFAANPIGEPFDPDELVRRYEAGEPIDDLVFRSDQKQVPIPGVAT